MLKKEASRQPVMISSLGAELSCDVGTNQKPRFRPGQTAIAEAKLDGICQTGEMKGSVFACCYCSLTSVSHFLYHRVEIMSAAVSDISHRVQTMQNHSMIIFLAFIQV